MSELLVETIYGSHLYGTNVPGSDLDIKRVYVASMGELIRGQTETRNRSEKLFGGVERETEEHHISKFCKMILQGQSLAYSMLFTPASHITYLTPAWNELLAHRSLLVSKQLKPFIGYAVSQARKYSIKGERLCTLEDFLHVVSAARDPHLLNDQGRLHKEVFEGVQQAFRGREGVVLHDEVTANGVVVRHIQVCGLGFGETTPVKLWIGPLTNLLKRFGRRAAQAKEDNGQDLKALYHAVRIIGEMNEILRTGRITYPRPEAPLLLEIRRGRLTNDEIADLIEVGFAASEELMRTPLK